MISGADQAHVQGFHTKSKLISCAVYDFGRMPVDKCVKADKTCAEQLQIYDVFRDNLLLITPGR